MADVIITGTSGKSGTLSTIYSKSRYNPVGSVKQSVLSEGQFQSKASSDWILADGRLLLVSSYPDLYSAITTTYGSGTLSGQPAFRVPDMRNRYARMSGSHSVGTCLSNSANVGSLSVSSFSFSLQCYQLGFPSGWYNVSSVVGSATNHSHSPTDLGVALQHDAGASRLRWVAFTGSPSYISDTCMCGLPSSPTGTGRTCKGMAVISSTGSAVNDTTESIPIVYNNPVLSSSDPETRPDTIVLNWFIKIK
jgi:hypothetical protein